MSKKQNEEQLRKDFDKAEQELKSVEEKITGKIATYDYSELQKLRIEVNRIGQNVNQLVRYVNTFDEIDNELFKALQAEIDDMKKLLFAEFKTKGHAKLNARRDGTYKIKIKQDVKYVMLATARGFLNAKEQWNTFGLKDSKTYTLNFALSPISRPVKMENIFYEFGRWELTQASEAELEQLNFAGKTEFYCRS